MLFPLGRGADLGNRGKRKVSGGRNDDWRSGSTAAQPAQKIAGHIAFVLLTIELRTVRYALDPFADKEGR